MGLPWVRDRVTENENIVVHIDDFIEREKASYRYIFIAEFVHFDTCSLHTHFNAYNIQMCLYFL